MNATGIRVRRPSAHRGGRSRCISGKSRINAMKARVITDPHGPLLFCGEVWAGSVADITQARDAGLTDLLADSMDLQILADAGYQGLGAQTCGQVVTPIHVASGDAVRWRTGSGPLVLPTACATARRRSSPPRSAAAPAVPACSSC
ncbi:transposase family protein [Streptomyces sp. NPDC058620]|uniref:transposase family protein n=1 Tax=Streptomyces sp. NPDC058620 TaxID=3346560 RepID=UPI003659FF04